jgi:hypothetical protein
VVKLLLEAVVGIVAGGLVVGVVTLGKRLRGGAASDDATERAAV